MNRVKRSMLVCMLAIALTTLLTAAVAEAAGLTSGKWSIVKSPNAGSDVNELLGVAAVRLSAFPRCIPSILCNVRKCRR